MGWVDQIARALLTFFEWIVNAVSQVIGDYLIEPLLNIVVYTPHPLSNGRIALFRQPTNGVWPTLYDAYLANLGTCIVLLIVAYLLMNFIQTAGVLSSYGNRQTKTDIVTTIVILPFGWAVGSLILLFSSTLTKYIMPEGPEFAGIVTAALATLGAATGIAGVNVIAGALSFIDLIVFVIVFAIYLFRIFYLMLIMYGMPYLLTFWLVKIPVLSEISKTLLSVFIKLSFLPLIVAMGLDLTTVLISGSGNLLVGNFDLAGIAQSLVALVFPLLTLGAFYIVMQASLGRSATRAALSAKRRYGGTTVGDTLPEQSLDKASEAGDKVRSGIEKPVTMAATSVSRNAKTGYGSARSRIAYETSWLQQVGSGVKQRSASTTREGIHHGTTAIKQSKKRIRDTVQSHFGDEPYRTSEQLAEERLHGESNHAEADPRQLERREDVVNEATAISRQDSSGPESPRRDVVDRAVSATQVRRQMRRQENHRRFEGS